MSGALRGLAVASIGQGERRHLDDAFSRDTQGLAAGGQETNVWGILQEDIGQHSDGVEKVLAIVDEQNCLAGSQVGHQDRGRPLSRLVDKAHRAHHGLGH